MTETPPTTAPDDEDDDDTVQGVARRGERERAEAARLQKEQNDAAGLTTAPDPADEPAETPADPKASGRKASGA